MSSAYEASFGVAGGVVGGRVVGYGGKELVRFDSFRFRTFRKLFGSIRFGRFGSVSYSFLLWGVAGFVIAPAEGQSYISKGI